MSSSPINVNPEWSLFLDRDGVINERIPGDYVKNCSQLVLLPGVVEAMKIFSELFGHIFVVTNQQGIGKGLMTEGELTVIHNFMTAEIKKGGGRIDRIYHCPHLESAHYHTRKPAPGMALQAKKEFPTVRFNHSIMVGDSISDMLFGKNLGMTTVFISDNLKQCRENFKIIDYRFPALYDFAKMTIKTAHNC
jgi:histidinol-phosphate phosphatase family protein